MRRFFKCLCVVLAASFTICGSMVNADPVSDKLKVQQDEVNKNKGAVSDAQKKIDDIENTIESLDGQIEDLNSKIAQNKDKIKSTQGELQEVEKKVKNAEDDLQKEEVIFGNRMSAIYKSGGNMRYAKIILDAKGVRELIWRIESIKKIAEMDRDIKNELNSKKTALEQNKKELNDENDKLVALQSSMESDLNKITANRNTQATLMAQAKEEEQTHESELSNSKAILAETNRRIALARDASPKVVTTNNILSRGGYSAAPLSDNSVVAYASNFRGTPYVMGGTSPSGFDCSGFVQYVYAHFGVALPRTTYDQVNVGSTVSRGNLQPGDLIFFGGPGNVYHVGMYVGNGTYIHSPHTGASVETAVLGDYYTAKRVR